MQNLRCIHKLPQPMQCKCCHRLRIILFFCNGCSTSFYNSLFWLKIVTFIADSSNNAEPAVPERIDPEPPAPRPRPPTSAAFCRDHRNAWRPALQLQTTAAG